MILTAVVFFAILSLLVFIHELGHFLMARFVGVHVEEFGLGLPPRAWGKKIGKTIYSLNWLPIGGFVRLAGEDEEPDGQKRLNPAMMQGLTLKKFFWARTKKERGAILIAGVTMNFVLAVILTAYLLTQGIPEPSGKVRVKRVVDNSPAQQAGLKENDILVSVQNAMTTNEPTRLTTIDELISFIGENKGKLVTITILRDGQSQAVQLTPREQYPTGEGPMGVAISDLETHVYPISEAPVKAVVVNVERAWMMLASIGSTIYRLVTLQPLRDEVAGPIGIARVTGEAVKFGFNAVIEFMSILSLNLAVLNILPIPALDGGRLAFVFLEKILGKKVRPAFERNAHQVGMIILIALILLVSINDIMKLASGS